MMSLSQNAKWLVNYVGYINKSILSLRRRDGRVRQCIWDMLAMHGFVKIDLTKYAIDLALKYPYSEPDEQV